MKANKIEKIIESLKPSQAVHLGHSSVIGNFGGLRVGLDLTSIDGNVPASFANLTLTSQKKTTYLIPLVHSQSMIARPEIVAESLDILIYTHLHPDHFSLQYIAKAIEKNPKLRIICPSKTKNYLQGKSNSNANNGFCKLISKLLSNHLLNQFSNGVEEFLRELEGESNDRLSVIQSIEEIDAENSLSIVVDDKEIVLSAFQVVHPSAQFYIRLPIENDPPPTLGYEIKYAEKYSSRTAILVGECATDPKTLARIFRERDQLSIVFFPITEQTEPKGIKLIEELVAHASLRTFAILERILRTGTIIVPLHQGLWYFQVTSPDIVNGRLALEKFARTPSSSLPFVEITKLFNSILFGQVTEARGFNLYGLLRKRWKLIKKIANVSTALPPSANVDGFPPGKLINFSHTYKDSHIPELSVNAIQSALQAHFTEFEGLRDEINNAWDWQKDLIQYTLLIIGTTITLVSTLPQLDLLLLVASYMLSAIGWSTMEQSIRMTTMGRYFKSILIPRVNSLILELDALQVHHPLKEKIKVWMWEDFFRAGNIRTALMGWAAMGKFSFALLPGIIFAIAFYILKQNSIVPWTLMEIIGFIVALGMGLMPLITAIFNARFSFKGEESA